MYAYLLGEGADPTDSIETLARRKRKEIECVSMGEGQDVVALRAINTATSMGSWVSSLLHSYCTYVYTYIHTYIHCSGVAAELSLGSGLRGLIGRPAVALQAARE